jgi:hypothetical protein
MTQQHLRTHFDTPRAAEYFHADELAKLTGQNPDRFAAVALKELMDNALDACESAGISPEVEVEATLLLDDGGDDIEHIRLTVTDNSEGIPPDVVERMLNFNTLTSDKAHYRTPSRGQQGNALKTIVAMPFALRAKDPLVIIKGQGVEHHIRASLLAGDIPDIRHEKRACPNDGGTSVSLNLPPEKRYAYPLFKPAEMVRDFHLFNPHAKVTFRTSYPKTFVNHDYPSGEEIAETHLPTDTGYKKFMPGDPLVIHWFGPEEFARLVYYHINQGHAGMPLGEFLKRFRGFSARAKASEVRKRVPGIRTLSDLSRDDIDDLYIAMRMTTKEPSHNVLGSPLGKAHLISALRMFHGATGRAWYKSVNSTLNGAPAFVEAVVVEGATPESPGGVYIGINHSPTYGDPLADELLSHGTDSSRVSGWGIKGFLMNAKVFDALSTYQENTAAIHITAAAPTTTDKGKTRLALDDDQLKDAVARVLWSVGKDLYKEAKQRDRDAAAAERAVMRRVKEAQQKTKRVNKADACYEVMGEAYAYSTGNGALPTTARDLYYAVRNRIERFDYDADELEYSYFSQNILPRYQREVNPLPLVEYEPRGTLYEPHGGKDVPLGTRSVAEYNFPDYVFDKILYIEKNGRVGILKAGGVDKRHDMALIGGQGYASEAIRTLFANAEEGEYQLFVLHDADPHGYSIARTLAEETERMPNHSVDVIDIGLKLEDALAMGKRPETFTRKKALDAKLELTDVEYEYFTGDQRKDGNGKPYWIAKRVELNDLSSPQLVEYVERKLKDSGVRPKVMPPDDALASMSKEMYQTKVYEWVNDAITRIIATDKLKKEMTKEFEDRFKLQGARAWIETGFKRDDEQSWRDAVNSTLRAAYAAKHKNDLHEAVREYVLETVQESNGKVAS